MENINSTNNQIHNEDSMNTTDLLIQALTAHFNDNPSNFTSYRSNIDQLLREHIKPMTSRSGKSSDGDDWKSQTKQRFSGRGAKWVKVSIDSILLTLDRLDAENCDTTQYRKNITEAGYAWIRFSAPRIAFDNIQAAAFEVRTEGSTKDHPKQLHYIALTDLDNQIEQMTGTPKSLNLEEDGTPTPSKPKAPKKKKEPKTESTLSDLADSINDELSQEEPELSELPDSSDPEEWSKFLDSEGLTDFDDSDVDFDDNF
jgi:hypothetical protein